MRVTRYAFVSVFVIVLAGCGVAQQQQQLNNLLEDLRVNELQKVSIYAQSVKLFLETHTTEQAIEKAKSVVSESLKDPSSAQFRNLQLVYYGEGRLLCGEVNGKNSYGGYVGFRPFVAGVNSATLYSYDERLKGYDNEGFERACR